MSGMVVDIFLQVHAPLDRSTLSYKAGRTRIGAERQASAQFRLPADALTLCAVPFHSLTNFALLAWSPWATASGPLAVSQRGAAPQVPALPYRTKFPK